MRRFVPFVAALPLLAACADKELRPLNPCIVSGVAEEIRIQGVDQVDVLFVIDNSGSMAEEQAALRDQLPRLVQTLATGRLRNPDGSELVFPPVASLHLGVVSTDLGVGPYAATIQGCDPEGDDGRLLSRVLPDAPATCSGFSPPTFLTFQAGSDDPGQVAERFGCMAVLGTGGCGLEQQLEAPLKALLPATLPPELPLGPFAQGRARGDTDNAGFLREDSLLAVVLVTDEEDCSASDLSLFDPDARGGRSTLQARCFDPANADALHPIERFVDGLAWLRRDRPDLLVFAPIVGVPPELATDAEGATDWDKVACTPERRAAGLCDPRMVPELVSLTYCDPRTGASGSPYVGLRPSCSRMVPGSPCPQTADPPNRITRVAELLEARGASVTVQSICQDDFSPAVLGILRKIADVLRGTCLPRALNRGADGRVACDVTETLPAEGAITRCDQLPGRQFVRTETDEAGRTHEVCLVEQLVPDGWGGAGTAASALSPPGGGAGWYYDDFTPDREDLCGPGSQRVAYAAGAEPIDGALVRLECLSPVTGSRPEALEVGEPCTAAEGLRCEDFRPDGRPARDPGEAMFCHEATNTCQARCRSDADCERLGLGGFRCPDEADLEGLGLAEPICVNPTCGT